MGVEYSLYDVEGKRVLDLGKWGGILVHVLPETRQYAWDGWGGPRKIRAEDIDWSKVDDAPEHIRHVRAWLAGVSGELRLEMDAADESWWNTDMTEPLPGLTCEVLAPYWGDTNAWGWPLFDPDAIPAGGA